MFQVHPELPGIIVHWFVTTLIKAPGHAPANTLTAAPILNRLQSSGEIAEVTQQLMEARQRDPEAQLWPEVAVDIIGEDYQRVGDIKTAIEIFKLNLLAYPGSADEEFRPRTIWSLSNAFTSAFKELDPNPEFRATAKLGGFLEARFSQWF
jgi:hypothetical protein